MKICLLSDARSVHIQRIVAGLADRGAQVHVVSHQWADLDGATVERFQIPSLSWRFPGRWRQRWHKYLEHFSKDYDVLHVHFLSDWGLTPELMDRSCFVATPWGSDIVSPPGEPVDHLAQLNETRRTMLQRATLVTAWGPLFAAQVAEFARIAVENIELLPLGVDTQLFKPIETVDRARTTDCQVGFFKGFREVYGPTTVIRAIPTVLEVYPAARFFLLGDGPQLTSCKTLAGNLGVEFHITWIPRQAHRNLPHHLAGWDVTVMPSVCESFGAAALESSAMCVPVIASNVGGIPDTVIDGQTGLLVPPQSPEQLADGMIHLLQDDALRAQLGRQGREFVQANYEWNNILDRWIDTYEMAIDRAGAMV